MHNLYPVEDTPWSYWRCKLCNEEEAYKPKEEGAKEAARTRIERRPCRSGAVRKIYFG
jgi:hypothetical protein